MIKTHTLIRAAVGSAEELVAHQDLAQDSFEVIYCSIPPATDEWVDLKTPKSPQAERLSPAQVNGLLQREIASEQGRRKLWLHLLHHEQEALSRAPWRDSVLSEKCSRPKAPLQLRHLVARGIPGDLRAGAWLMCTGAIKRMRARQGYYRRLVAELAEPESCSTAAKRVAAALVRRYGGLRNVAGPFDESRIVLEAVAGALMDRGKGTCFAEEAAFWFLVQVYEYMLPLDYVATQLSLAVDLCVFCELLKEVDPEVAAHLASFAVRDSGDPLVQVVARTGLMEAVKMLFCIPPQGWPTGVATRLEFLEWSHRVMDMFVFLGESVLFAAALGLVQAARVEILASATLREALPSVLGQDLNEPLLGLVYSNACSVTRAATLAALRAKFRDRVVQDKLLARDPTLHSSRRIDAPALAKYHVRQRAYLRKALSSRMISQIQALCRSEESEWTSC